MKMRIPVLVVVLVMLAAAAGPAVAQTHAPQTPQTPRAYSLAELVAAAEERNPTLAVARQAVAAAEAAVALARAGLGVTVTARGSAATAGGGTTTTTSFSSSASLVASYTLYDSGQTAYAVQQAEANLRSSRAALEATRQDTALAVGQAYVAVLRAERTVVLQQQQVVRNQELVRIAQGQFDAGVVARSDVVRAQAGLAAAQSDLIAAQNVVDQSKATLNVAIGASPMIPIAVAPPPSVPPVTVTYADLSRLAEERPELRKARSDAEGAEAAVRLAQAGGGLKVTLDGTATQVLSPTAQTTYSTGVGMSFPISDAGRASAAVAQATANLQAARARIDSVRLTTVQDGVGALLNLSSAAARVESARAGLAFAEESLRLARARYAAGAAPIFEVTDAQTTLLAAEVALANAIFDQLAGSLQLRRALGRSVVDGAI
ncbi:MAG: TolC family protein [bacterium]|nr:TolC family protein [bacterium]